MSFIMQRSINRIASKVFVNKTNCEKKYVIYLYYQIVEINV